MYIFIYVGTGAHDGPQTRNAEKTGGETRPYGMRENMVVGDGFPVRGYRACKNGLPRVSVPTM